MHSKPIPAIAGLLLAASGIGACASDGAIRPRPQIRDCPPGEVLICESRAEPSRGGDEEIPVYERCYCRRAM